jgi:hypothetical protein
MEKRLQRRPKKRDGKKMHSGLSWKVEEGDLFLDPVYFIFQ